MPRGRNILVDVLAVIFGISSWLEISGIGVEMPLMVQVLPEGWRLGSHIVVITQLANIGPLAYGIVRRYKSHKVLEIPMIHITLSVASLSCLLLSFFWNHTGIIAGQEHSVALLTLAFFLALVDCTSSVLYLPFMANFREIYVISCMIGEGACGLFPSIVGFIQGVGGQTGCQNKTLPDNTTVLEPTVPEPRFSVGVYFVILFLMVVLSWIAFVLLYKLPQLDAERVSAETGSILHCTVDSYATPGLSCTETLENSDSLDEKTTQPYLTKFEYYCLLVIQNFVCVLQNGVLSSIQPFSCMPYGSVTYQLAVNLSLISNPLGCFVALLRPAWTLKFVIFHNLASMIWAAYILAMALLSPTPPLVDSPVGSFLVVLSWVAYVGMASYIKASIAAILRRHGGNQALFWGGAVSQIGSGVGGIFMYAIVNYTSLFTSGPSCTA